MQSDLWETRTIFEEIKEHMKLRKSLLKKGVLLLQVLRHNNGKYGVGGICNGGGGASALVLEFM
jgi:hypothetical protein